MSQIAQSPAELREILRRARTIAVLGYSTNPAKAGHYVPAYLHDQGYRVIGVNPAFDGDADLPVVADLADLPEPADLIVIFRRPDQLMDHLDALLALAPRPDTVWLQLGIRHDDFAQRLVEAGIDVVQDRCMKVEHARLMH